MKISKNELELKKTYISDLVPIISKILWPFEYQIENRRIAINLILLNVLDFEMETDWNLYELCLFNIL